MVFTINGVVWRVKKVPPYDSHLLRPDGSYTIGMCNNVEKVIYIIEGLNPSQFYKVLAHEVTHAAMYSYSVGLTIDQEELLADIISTYGGEIVKVTNKVFRKIKKQGWY